MKYNSPKIALKKAKEFGKKVRRVKVLKEKVTKDKTTNEIIRKRLIEVVQYEVY